jgi:adenylosuccinate lyase
MMLPDHFGIISYSALRMKNVVENLVIERERIEAKVESNEIIFSSFVLHKLIQINPTAKREELYEAVQTSFFKATNKDELKVSLEKELNARGLNHHATQWVNFENLRDHYKTQFKSILKRV